MNLAERITSILEQIRLEHAPDPRLSVFEVEVDLLDSDSTVRLVGFTSEPAAAEALHRRMAGLGDSLTVEDRIIRLPHGIEDGRGHALVTVAVAPMLAGPLVSDSHVSQALMGQHLLILRRHGRWLQCRSEDGYLGWVHRGYVARVDESAARAWRMGADGEPCLSLGAELRAPDGEVVARLPWGARVLRLDGGPVRIPDGRMGRVSGELLPLSEQPGRFPPRGEAIVETALRWLGAPYLWGGTTPAGVDCSGLVQAVFRTHGVELPRDSDQQARAGVEVDPGPDFRELRPGDLLFFAEEAGRVTHVTISTGGSAIVHSSLGNGGVRRNDLLGDLRFERELRKIFVRARRVVAGEP